MDAKTRRAHIADVLRTRGEVSITELALVYGTSEMTIRRDLDQLESDGVARRSRGGAISIQSRSFEPPILQRAAQGALAKRAIGQLAASLVRENDIVFLDVGTTMHEMARALPDDMPLTVMTSSLLIATELASKATIKVIIPGGVIRPGELSLIGARAQRSFEDLNCDAVFMGVAGVCDQKGLTEYNLDDAEVKRSAMAVGRRVIVLADESKLGRVALATFATIESVDVLITNAPASHPIVRKIRDADVEVLHTSPLTKENP